MIICEWNRCIRLLFTHFIKLLVPSAVLFCTFWGINSEFKFVQKIIRLSVPHVCFKTRILEILKIIWYLFPPRSLVNYSKFNFFISDAYIDVWGHTVLEYTQLAWLLKNKIIIFYLNRGHIPGLEQNIWKKIYFYDFICETSR